MEDDDGACCQRGSGPVSDCQSVGVTHTEHSQQAFSQSSGRTAALALWPSGNQPQHELAVLRQERPLLRPILPRLLFPLLFPLLVLLFFFPRFLLPIRILLFRVPGRPELCLRDASHYVPSTGAQS